MLHHREPDPERGQILPQPRLPGPKLGLSGPHLVAQLGLPGQYLVAQPGLPGPHLVAQLRLTGPHVLAQLGLTGPYVVAQIGLAGEHVDPKCAQVLPDPRLSGQNQSGEGREREIPVGRGLGGVNGSDSSTPTPMQIRHPSARPRAVGLCSRRRRARPHLRPRPVVRISAGARRVTPRNGAAVTTIGTSCSGAPPLRALLRSPAEPMAYPGGVPSRMNPDSRTWTAR